MGVKPQSTLSVQKMNTNHTEDPYAFLTPLCGTTAFQLPSIQPIPCPSSGSPPPPTLFGAIPNHLLHHYLCYDLSPKVLPNLPESVTDDPHSAPLPNLQNENDDNCSNQQRDIVDNDVFHQQQCEILPPCVINRQDSLPFTPEAEEISWASLLLSEVKELGLCQCGNGVFKEDYLLSVVTKFRNLNFELGYGRKVLTQIKELAVCNLMGAAIVDKGSVNYMIFVMKKFRSLAFHSLVHGNFCYDKDSLELPSKKRQRKQNREERNVEVCSEPNSSSWFSTLLRRSRILENQYSTKAVANLRSGNSKLVNEEDNIELTSHGPSGEQSMITIKMKWEALVQCQSLRTLISSKPRYLDVDES